MWKKNIIRGITYIIVSSISIPCIFIAFRLLMDKVIYFISDFYKDLHNFFWWWLLIILTYMLIKFLLKIFGLITGLLTSAITFISPSEKLSIVVTYILSGGCFLIFSYSLWSEYSVVSFLIGAALCIVTFLAVFLTIDLITSTRNVYIVKNKYKGVLNF